MIENIYKLEKIISLMIENKRGQGLSTNAIILIILGIVILVVLILGFSLGFDRLAPFLGGGPNVDDVVSGCQIACNTNAQFAFCSQERELNDGTNEVTATCDEFSDNEEYAKYGIESCSSIQCPAPEGEQ